MRKKIHDSIKKKQAGGTAMPVGAWFKLPISRYRIIPLVIILAIIMVVWCIRMDAVVKLEITTDYVMLDLVRAWTAEFESPLALKSLYIDHIDMTASQQANPLPIAVPPRIEETNVCLQSLGINNNGRDANLELSADDFALNLFVKNARIEGVYNKWKFQGADNGKSVETEPPETIHIKTAFSGSVATRVELRTDREWLMDKIPIRKMLIQKERPKGSGQFVPKVKTGEIQILNSGKTTAMGWGDRLRIDGIKENRRMTIEKNPNGFKISFLGKLGVIDAGPDGFETDLRPRLIEYALHGSPLGVFMAAFTLLWSVYGYFEGVRKKDRS